LKLNDDDDNDDDDEVGTLKLNPAKESGERCKFSQQVWAERQPKLDFGAFLALKSDMSLLLA